MNIDEVRILGVKIHRVDMKDCLKLLENFISDKRKHQVCVPNAWTTVLMQKDQEFKNINNSSSLAIPDGMPLVWVSRLYGKPIPERVPGSDLFQEFAKISSLKGYKFFFLGSTPETLKNIIKKLKEKYSSLKIVGTYAPPFLNKFSVQENKKMIDEINKAKPDVLFVGLTAPKQEKWISENLERLNVRLAIGIGAAFDFVAGKTKRAPRWMQNTGLEWFHRLSQEPRRLWKRYIMGNTIFIWLVTKELVRIKILKKSE